jgi:hypothetical protein
MLVNMQVEPNISIEEKPAGWIAKSSRPLLGAFSDTRDRAESSLRERLALVSRLAAASRVASSLGRDFDPNQWPHGLRCVECDREIGSGDRYIERPIGFVDDTPALEVVCQDCGRGIAH